MFFNIYVHKPTTVQDLFLFLAVINLFLWQYCLVDCQGTRSNVLLTSGFLSRQTAQYAAFTWEQAQVLACAYFSF